MGIYENTGSGGGGGNPVVVTIDISNLNIIDMTGNESADIVNLTSTNLSETIWEVINTSSTKKIQFRPSSILDIDWINETHRGVPIGVTPNLILYADPQTTNGGKGGYIELQARVAGQDLYETDFMDSYDL